MARSSVEFTVVCIESIPACARVAVCGYYSWCMSGSLAGQLFSQFFVLGNFFKKCGGLLDLLLCSNGFCPPGRCPSGGTR